MGYIVYNPLVACVFCIVYLAACAELGVVNPYEVNRGYVGIFVDGILSRSANNDSVQYLYLSVSAC